jgi:hypothetical protein
MVELALLVNEYAGKQTSLAIPEAIDFFAQALMADSINSLSRPSLLPQY